MAVPEDRLHCRRVKFEIPDCFPVTIYATQAAEHRLRANLIRQELRKNAIPVTFVIFNLCLLPVNARVTIELRPGNLRPQTSRAVVICTEGSS